MSNTITPTISNTITPTVFYRTLNVEGLEIFYREAGPQGRYFTNHLKTFIP